MEQYACSSCAAYFGLNFLSVRLMEETDQYLIYWYFPNDDEDEMHGIILID